MMYDYDKVSNMQRLLGPGRCYTLWLGACFTVAISSVAIGILGNYHMFLDLFMNSNRIVAKITLIIVFNIVMCALFFYGAVPAYRYFAEYAIDENGLILIMPTGKHTVYSWSSIAFADVTFAYVNRQPRKYIRIFVDSRQAKHRNTRYSCLEHYLMDQSSVIVFEYSQDRLEAIQHMIPIQDSVKKKQ